jgi:8-oxo-dGTP diphosphatase
MREFGERTPGVVYVRRPGAYAVVIDEEGRVAVMRTAKGWGLPGGGADEGESPHATLRREVLEECGREVVVGEPCGEALEYVHARGEGHFAKECRFFRATFGPRIAEPVEADHVLEWLDVGVAVVRLTHRSQAWILERVTSAGGGA